MDSCSICPQESPLASVSGRRPKRRERRSPLGQAAGIPTEDRRRATEATTRRGRHPRFDRRSPSVVLGFKRSPSALLISHLVLIKQTSASLINRQELIPSSNRLSALAWVRTIVPVSLLDSAVWFVNTKDLLSSILRRGSDWTYVNQL
jgi:hypothetical protein